MEKHYEFRDWAISQGVRIQGIAPHQFPGKGVGIIAEKDLEARTTILTVPSTALQTAYTVPKPLKEALQPITTHGLLAAHLSLSRTSHSDPWTAVLPSMDDFSNMPLLYPKSLHAFLPHACTALLQHQQEKLAQDWKTVSSTFSILPYETYLHNWLSVNTRTFYYVSPLKKHKKPSNADDCMALNPFADYFNHTSSDTTAVEVEFSPKGYKFTTAAPFKKGEELFISYGNHSNDFLLAEYGFILDENEHDQISLDTFLLSRMSQTQKELLDEEHFLGNYNLDRNGPCFRTQVVLRMLALGGKKWRRFLNGFDEEETDKLAANSIFDQVKNDYAKLAERMIRELEKSENGNEGQRSILSKRWRQIQVLLANANNKS